MNTLRYWLRAWNVRRKLKRIMKNHPESFKNLFGEDGPWKHTLAPSEMTKDIFKAVRQKAAMEAKV